MCCLEHPLGGSLNTHLQSVEIKIFYTYNKDTTRLLYLVFLFFYLYFLSLATVSAAIYDPPSYGQDVKVWWASYWANPKSSNYIAIGQIPSPANIVTLAAGSNIQNTIDALPQTGGTILLQPGTYSGDIKIFSRNNIHIKGLGNSPSQVILTGTIYVAGCKDASPGYRSDSYNFFVNSLFSSNNQLNLDCINNKRATNIYFYNFTMDAQGRFEPVQSWIELANGVVFDKIVWQGMSNDITKVHLGHANGHVIEDNIWFRGNVFKGVTQTAVYLDGCHSCGVVESDIEANFYNAGIIHLDNNDLDYDYNKNGIIENNELRNGRYLVTAFNRFIPTSNASAITTHDWFNIGILYEGANILTANNTFTANINTFVYEKGACSYHTKTILNFFDIVIENNFLVNNVGPVFFEIEHNPQYCNLGGATTYNLGKYIVANNAVRKAGSGFNFVKEITGPIEGPNVVENNCLGSTCADPPKSSTIQQPTIQPSIINPTLTAVPTPVCNLGNKGDANCDKKIDGADYVIWLNHYSQNVYGSQHGDFNTDSIVDGKDYIIWLNNYDNAVVPTTTPSHTSTSYFPYAIFEDGNLWGGTGVNTTYQKDINQLKAKNITDIIFTNSTPNLDISDSNGMSVIGAPQNVLNQKWWSNAAVTETIEKALEIARPIIDADKNHPSLKGYNLADDVDHYSINKITLITSAFNQLNPTLPSTVMAPNNTRFNAANPPVYLTYRYPAMVTDNQCDFNSKQIMSYYVNTFGQALKIDRERLRLEERGIPEWLILQAHGSTFTTNANEADITKLRTPSIEEVRMQNWIALGEGIDGIGWFIYKTQQFWIGLEDNPALFSEIGDLAGRVKPLRGLFSTLKKHPMQLFTVSASDILPFENQPYLSTMVTKDNSKYYLMVVNQSCSPQSLSLNSEYFNSSFKDIETGTTYSKTQQIYFRAGDGKIFEVLGTVIPPNVQRGVNVVSNGSFENGIGSSISDWFISGNMSKDNTVARSGLSSLKFSGPMTSSYIVVPISLSPLKPNTQYSVSYWVKTQNVLGNGLSLRYVHLNPSVGFSLPPLSMNSVNGTTDWRQVTDTFYTFNNLQSSRFDLMYELSGGTAWIDDIVICEGNLGCNGLFPYN